MPRSSRADASVDKRRPYLPKRVPRPNSDALDGSELAGLNIGEDDPLRMERFDVRARRRPKKRRWPSIGCVLLQICGLGSLVALSFLGIRLPLDLGGGFHPAVHNHSAAARRPPTPPLVVRGQPPAAPYTGASPPAAPPSVVSAALKQCPTWAPALGFGGATVALVFSSLGSAYGTGKAARGISEIGGDAIKAALRTNFTIGKLSIGDNKLN